MSGLRSFAESHYRESGSSGSRPRKRATVLLHKRSYNRRTVLVDCVEKSFRPCFSNDFMISLKRTTSLLYPRLGRVQAPYNPFRLQSHLLLIYKIKWSTTLPKNRGKYQDTQWDKSVASVAATSSGCIPTSLRAAMSVDWTPHGFACPPLCAWKNVQFGLGPSKRRVLYYAVRSLQNQTSYGTHYTDNLLVTEPMRRGSVVVTVLFEE